MMAFCNMCGKYEISTCGNCGFQGCNECMSLHNDSCSIFMERKIHLCMNHNEIFKDYCCQCQQLTCRQCKIDDHYNHPIISIFDTVGNIIQSRNNALEDIRLKITEERNAKDMLCEEQKQYGDVENHIKEEAERLRQLISEKEALLLKQISESTIKIENRSEKVDEVIFSLESMKDSLNSLGVNQLHILFLVEWSKHQSLMEHFKQQQLSNEIVPKNKTFYSRSDVNTMFQDSISKDACNTTDICSMDSTRENEIWSLNVNQHTNPSEMTAAEEKSEDQSTKTKMENLVKQANEMTATLATKEKQIQYMLGLLKELPSSVSKINKMETTGENLTLPRMNDTIMDSFTEKIEGLLNHMISLKNDLLKCQDNLERKCESVMKWTTEETQDREQQRALNEQQLNSERQQNSRLRDNIYHLQQQLQAKGHKTEMHQLHERIKRYEDILINKNLEIKSWKESFGYLQKANSENECTLKKVTREKDELQCRLSSIAGDKLTHGNPAITDLGDPNRPMKIGEQYCALYDNEWTDAIECTGDVKRLYPHTEDSKIEEIIIHHLCRILMFTYEQCLQLSQDQLYTLAKTLCGNIENDDIMISSMNGIKELMAAQKLNAESCVEWILQSKVPTSEHVAQNWDQTCKNTDLITLLLQTPFYKKCVYLCWSMAIQDPVMYLDEEVKRGTKFDRNIYKEFLHSGDTVRYVVWPALFLHKDGPLLYKGVVQVDWEHTNVES